MNQHSERQLRVLTFTSLFPNSQQPRHGIFIETRLRHLRDAYPAVCNDVIAPVPCVPIVGKRLSSYSVSCEVSSRETYAGFDVFHPRFIVLPGVSWRVSPLLMYSATKRLAAELHAERNYALIDAHYFYPDGVAAVMLGKALGIPVMITARGSDITVLPNYALPRVMIKWAATNADAVATVCEALKGDLGRLGVSTDKIRVLRNGVDLERFQPVEQNDVRSRYEISTPYLLVSVGNLVELKGIHLTIESLDRLPECSLIVVGSGPERQNLEDLARSAGVADRVRFVANVPQSELSDYYSAADVHVLASRSEGWANVLLEAMACGCPAVATRVGGAPEIVAAPEAGRLVTERTPGALAAAIADLLHNADERSATRAYAEQFDWQPTSEKQYEIFSQIADKHSLD